MSTDDANSDSYEPAGSLSNEPANFPGSVLFASQGPNIFCTDNGRIAITARGVGGSWETVSFDSREIPVIVKGLQAGVRLSAEILLDPDPQRECSDSLREEPADFPGSMLFASLGPNIFCTDEGKIVIAARGFGFAWQFVSFHPLQIPVICERLQAGVRLSVDILLNPDPPLKRSDSLLDEPANFPGSVLFSCEGSSIFCTDEGRIVISAPCVGKTEQFISLDPLEIPVIVERLQAGVRLSAEIFLQRFLPDEQQ